MPDHSFLYTNSEIKSRAIFVYLYLEERTNNDGVCWPAIPTIAAELKCSRSTVERAISDLKKFGLVQTKQRYRFNGSYSSLEFYLPKAARKTRRKD